MVGGLQGERGGDLWEVEGTCGVRELRGYPCRGGRGRVAQRPQVLWRLRTQGPALRRFPFPQAGIGTTCSRASLPT